MVNKLGHFAGSFLWGASAKILDAAIKFLTIPLLLHYFGKEHYGILTLAIATNAYMQLLDMGMNTGGVKFFSQWIVAGNYQMIDRVARTNISFYLLIGLVNSGVLIVIGFWGEGLFKISTEDFYIFRYLLCVMSVFSILNWLIFVFNQLLIADEKIIFTQQMLIIKSILGLAVIGATLIFKLTLLQYFSCYLFVNAVIIVPYYLLCKKQKLISSFLPAFYWKDFSVVFKYGLAILAMGLFQFTATQSRPLILGMFSNDGVGVLTDYRIIEMFPVFIISIGGMLITIFLPHVSKAVQNNDRKAIEKMAYEGTLFTSILVSLMCFPIIIVAKELLILYVGTSYSHLTIWLMLWVFTLALYLHNTPVASLILATGKTKMLVYSSAIACIFSLILNAVLANRFGVGSAVIGYLSYIIIQTAFYYLYFNRKVLELKSLKVFKSFIIPTGLAFLFMIIIMLLPFQFNNLIIGIIIKVGGWGILYLLGIFGLRILNFDELLHKLKTKRGI
jgi:O-antigen/teichoic acid export membrane protein